MADLPRTEDKYQILFNSIDEGFHISELIYDQNGQAIDWRFLEVNQVFERQTGLQNVEGQLGSVIAPGTERHWLLTYDQVVRTGEPTRFEDYNESTGRWYSLYTSRVGGEGSRQFAVVFDDITERKMAENRQTFLLQLSDVLRPLSDSAQMERMAMQMLGQELGVNRAFFATIDAEGESWSIRHDYANGVASHVGRYPMSQFQRSRLTQWQAGRVSSITDSETDSRLSVADRAAYADFGTRAAIGVPLVKGGRFAALLSVNQTGPRTWTEAELALTSETAERTWVAIEGARALEALRESDERFRTLVQNLPDYAIFRIDPNGIISEWTEGAQRVKGYTAEEVVGQSIALFYTPEGLAAGELTTEMEQATQHGRAERESIRIRKVDGRPDGERFWVNEIMTAIRDEEGRLVGFTKISRDITERKKADEALFDSRQRLQIVLDSIADYAIITVDPQSRIVSWNPGAQQMFGYTAEEAIGQSAAIIFTPEDRATGQMEKEMDRTRWQGQAPDERYHLRKDGSRLYVSGTQAPLYDADKTLLGYVKVARDLTDRQQMEQALRETNRRKDEFLAMLAHELRNPLSTLHNTLLLLGLTHGQDESLPLDRALGMMTREVTHLNRMIDDLLDVSRINQGKIQLNKERLDLGKLIRETLEAARSQFANRGQALTVHLPDEPVWVDGDPTRLTQVMRNLATNATKYTPNGGQIKVTLEKERGQAVVRIWDSGIGIAAEQLKAIFEVFVQVSASLDRPQGGLGLGLAVVKQLVELHGGHVGVYSSGLGQGSEFTVSLPSLPDAPPQGTSAGASDGQARQAERILVVDDNADLAMTTAMLLRHKKYEAHTRLSGSEALEAVELLQPTAILLDLGMPGMDGFETCRRLRATEWGKHGVIVALSGYGQEEDRKQTRESGFDGHLVKPLNLQALTELLNKLLNTNDSTK